MNIALIAHDFPPFNVGGSQRPYLMAKMLSQNGVNVTVFTLKQRYYNEERLNFPIDLKGFDNIKIIRTNVKTRRKFMGDSHYFNLVDDTGQRWYKYLRDALKAESQNTKFDYLIITSPPFSVAKISMKLSLYLNIPYIFDMRDAWSQWVLAPYATIFHYRMTKSLELEVLKKAKFVLYVSKQQLLDLKAIHTKLNYKKFLYTPNGFVSYKNFKSTVEKIKIRIVYTGSFYFNPYSQNLINSPWYKKKWFQIFQYVPRKEDWSYRSPIYFFNILNELKKLDKDLFNKIEVVFAGEKPNWFNKEVERFNLNGTVQHFGFLSKAEIESLLYSAELLLITSSKVIGGREYSAAGKTFEYMSYQKPIIGVVCEGEQKALLEQMESAIILNPDNKIESAKILHFNLKNRNLLKPNLNFYDKFLFPNNFENLEKIVL